MSALREPGADKEQSIHGDRFQEMARGGCGPPTAGPFPARRPAGGLPGRGPAGSPRPWTRANPVTRCRLGRGPEKGGKEKGRERRPEGGMGGGLGQGLLWSALPQGRPKLPMLPSGTSCSSLGCHTVLLGPCLWGLAGTRGGEDGEAGRSPVWVSNQQRGSGPMLLRAVPSLGPLPLHLGLRCHPQLWGGCCLPRSLGWGQGPLALCEISQGMW